MKNYKLRIKSDGSADLTGLAHDISGAINALNSSFFNLQRNPHMKDQCEILFSHGMAKLNLIIEALRNKKEISGSPSHTVEETVEFSEAQSE